MPPLPSRIGNFEIVRRLGSGGMGTVYLGRDPELKRPVAIKILREQVHDPDLLERFFREARAAAALRHPNIITIYTSGQHEYQPFIVMEFVDGESLADVIRRQGPLTLADKLSYIEQICAGLHFAHRAGIVHRDVKPANLMVDRDGVIRILDFGIARIEGSGMTRDGVMIGTLNYMSPEQMLGRAVDYRSDIFAVGAVAYEILCYQQAFRGGLQDGLLHRLPYEDPPPLKDLCTGVPADLEEVVTRALQKDPAKRFRDMGEMRAALVDVRRRLEADASLETIVVARQSQPSRPPSSRKSGVAAAEKDSFGMLGQPSETKDRSIRQRLADASAQLERGDTTGAARLLQQVIALDPANQTAADMLKRVQQTAGTRVGETEADRATLRAARDAAPSVTVTAGTEAVMPARRTRSWSWAAVAAGVVIAALVAIPWLASRNDAPEATSVTAVDVAPAPAAAAAPTSAAPPAVESRATAPTGVASVEPGTLRLAAAESADAGTAATASRGTVPAAATPKPSVPTPVVVPSPTPANAATAPPVDTGAIDAEIQDLLARARTMYTAGDLAGALDMLAKQPAAASDARIVDLAARVTGAAFDAMNSAEKSAAARSAETYAADTLRPANDAKSRAEAFRQRSAYVDAGLQALLARDGFQQAAVDALARRTPPAATVAPPAAAAPAAAPPPAAVVSNPLERERTGIIAALGRFQAAYRDRDINALQQVYPSLQRETRQRIERSFRDCRAYDVTFDNEQFLFNPNDPNTVQVSVNTTYACTVRTGQRPQIAEQRDVFILRKRGDAWFIDRTGSID